jgi:hypothetical protein
VVIFALADALAEPPLVFWHERENIVFSKIVAGRDPEVPVPDATDGLEVIEHDVAPVEDQAMLTFVLGATVTDDCPLTVSDAVTGGGGGGGGGGVVPATTTLTHSEAVNAPPWLVQVAVNLVVRSTLGISRLPHVPCNECPASEVNVHESAHRPCHMIRTGLPGVVLWKYGVAFATRNTHGLLADG